MDETEEGREKRTTGMQEIVRLMYTEVVRIRDVFFVFSSVSFFLFFLFFLFLKNERNEFSIDFVVCFDSVVNDETIRENNGTSVVSYVKEVFYVNKMIKG